jgi:hypothetical protein
MSIEIRRTSRRLAVRAISAILALCAGILPRSVNASDFGFPASADFKILNGDGSRVVGYSHYSLKPNGTNSYLLYEEDHFLDGQHDIEHDQLQARGPGLPAVVTTFEHDYFDADGSPKRAAKANFRTGEASCTVYENGRARVSSSRLDFPLDTYSGSTVLIPVDYYLRRGSRRPISMHNFNCVPGPEILGIKIDPRYPAFWDHYPGRLLEMRLKPDFGWLNMLIAPFVPSIDAWFDPSKDWEFVGSRFYRYYKGPEIIFVRIVTTANHDKLRQTPDIR